MRRKKVFLAIAVMCLILTASPCAAMFDAFLQIDGIKGESTDKDHKDWIEVLSFSHQVSQPASQPPSKLAAGSSQISLPAHGDFAIVKLLDKASPKLIEACSYARLIKFANIDVVRNGQTYLRVHLENVVISSITSLMPDQLIWTPTLSSAPISAALQESVSLKYGKVTWTYMSLSGAGSSSGSYDSAKRRFSTD